MNDKNNIPKATDLPYSDAEVGDKGNLENLDNIDIEAPEKDIVDIATPKDSLLKRGFRLLHKAIRGENGVGKKAGHVLGIVGVFVPPVAKIRSGIKGIFNLDKSQQKTSDMKFLQDLKRRLKQPSGKAALTVIAMVAAYFGADVNADLLGEVLVNVTQGVIAVIGGGATIYEMFRDEDKNKEE